MDRHSICSDFEAKRSITLESRIQEIASKEQFLGIADTSHERPEIHEFIVRDDFMQGLANAGIKHVFHELFDPAAERIFGGFRDGKITEEDLRRIVGDYFQTNLTDMSVGKDRAANLLSEYMVQAKKYGMEIHAVNHFDGYYTEGEFDIFANGSIKLADLLLDIMENNPEYRTAGAEDKSKTLERLIREYGQNNPDFVRDVEKIVTVSKSVSERNARAIQTYEDDGLSNSDAVKKVQQDLLSSRFSEDDEVAQRILDAAGDDKAVVIYGRHHFDRRFGDLNAHLKVSDNPDHHIAEYEPESMVWHGVTTLSVYADRQEQDDLRPPVDASGLNWFFNERMDYTVDAATLTWQKRGDPLVCLDVAVVEGVDDQSRRVLDSQLSGFTQGKF